MSADKKTTRRDFIKTGAAGGLGAAAFSSLVPDPLDAQEMAWDQEYDVVVVGAGAGGFAAAIAARDEGASVILVEQNYDIGGRAILSGAAVYCGGGISLQKDAGIEDSPEAVFHDWAIMDQGRNRYTDRELAWKFAQNAVATFDFLTDNGVVWGGWGARAATTRCRGGPRRSSGRTPRRWSYPRIWVRGS
jgi:succinate dehydrogenase/fumarate reductase flavoprotein subunit